MSKSDKCEKYLSPDQLDIMKSIGEIADQTDQKCYLVGGMVRDCLLGKKSDDLDFVCTDVEKVANGLIETNQANGIGEVETSRYLTKIVHFPNGEKADIVEPRKEIYTKDSIKPIVTKGTLEDDAFRRDFTINTLRLGVNEDNWLEIDDPTERGLDDLSNMVLDTPLDPDQTFEDEPTRILRAVRFASCKKMSIKPRVIQSIRDKRGEVNRIPKEQIHKELMKGSECDNYFEIMDSVGLLEVLFPEVTQLKGVHQNPKGHTLDAFGHTMRYIEELPNDSVIRLVGLLHDIGKADKCDDEGHCFKHEVVSAEKTEDILTRYKFSNEQIKRMKRLVGSHMKMNELLFKGQPTDKQLKRFLFENKDILNDLEIMTRADTLADHPQKEVMIKRIDEIIKQLNAIESDMGNVDQFVLSVNGNDIMDLGFEGKDVGKIKSAITNLVQDGTLPNNKSMLLDYIKDTYAGEYL